MTGEASPGAGARNGRGTVTRVFAAGPENGRKLVALAARTPGNWPIRSIKSENRWTSFGEPTRKWKVSSARGIQAGVDGLQAQQAARQQGGAGEQEHRDGDLARDQPAARAAARRGAAAAGLLQRVRQRRLRRDE